MALDLHRMPIFICAFQGTFDLQKSEYSLTQHLVNNLIGMYINLPSKNNYRRPVSYASKGHRTRRMAVDFAIPLITNVKSAKLLNVSNIDSKSSYLTQVFPGLVNVAAFVPRITDISGDDGFDQAMQAALRTGFTMSMILAHSVDGSITDAKSLQHVQTIAASNAYCNYALKVTSANSQILPLDDEFKPNAKVLFIAFYEPAGPPEISTVAANFAFLRPSPCQSPQSHLPRH